MLGESLLVTPILQKSTTQGSRILLRHSYAHACWERPSSSLLSSRSPPLKVVGSCCGIFALRIGEIGLPGGLIHIMIGTSYSHRVPSPSPPFLQRSEGRKKSFERGNYLSYRSLPLKVGSYCGIFALRIVRLDCQEGSHMLGESLLVTPVLQKSTTQGSRILLRHSYAHTCWERPSSSLLSSRSPPLKVVGSFCGIFALRIGEIGLPGGLIHIMIGTSYSHRVPSPSPPFLQRSEGRKKSFERGNYLSSRSLPLKVGSYCGIFALRIVRLDCQEGSCI